MAPFLTVLLLQSLTFNVYSDESNIAIVRKIGCTDADCCKNCQTHRHRTVDLDECYQVGALSVWSSFKCNGNQFIYEQFDNSWCGGKPEEVKTSGRCYKDGLVGSYYYECSRNSMVHLNVDPSPIGRNMPLKQSNAQNNKQQNTPKYAIEAIVIFIVLSLGIFGGYLIYRKRRRKRVQHLKPQQKDLLTDL